MDTVRLSVTVRMLPLLRLNIYMPTVWAAFQKGFWKAALFEIVRSREALKAWRHPSRPRTYAPTNSHYINMERKVFCHENGY